jgi:hypothetical protein
MKPFEEGPIRFLLTHLLGGVVGAVAFVLLILYVDLAGLRTLAFADPAGWLFIALLFFGLVITFGLLAMGISIMTLGRDGR